MRSASFAKFAGQAWYNFQEYVEEPAIALGIEGHEEMAPIGYVNRSFPSITPIRETDREPEPYDKDVSIIDTDSPYGPAIVW